MYCMIHIQNLVYYLHSDIFRHIHVLLDIFSHIVAYLEPCVTLAYLEPCYIQNSSIFRTQDMFRTLSIKVYSGISKALCNASILRTLTFSELCHIQTFGIFRTRGIFRTPLMQVPSGIFKTMIGIVILNFVCFFYFTFQQNLKRHIFFDYNDVNFNARPSLLK